MRGVGGRLAVGGRRRLPFVLDGPQEPREIGALANLTVARDLAA